MSEGPRPERDDAAIAATARSIVSSVGKLDPEWSAAEAYEHGQERLLLFILLGPPA